MPVFFSRDTQAMTASRSRFPRGTQVFRAMLFQGGARFAMILAAALPCGPATGQTLLRWKFEPGQSARYVTTEKNTISIKVGEETAEASASRELHSLRKVVAVDDQGTAAMEQTLERVVLSVKKPGQDDAVFDSDDPKKRQGLGKQQILPLIRATQATPVTFRWSADGKISDVSIGPALQAALLKTSSEDRVPTFSKKGLEKFVASAAVPLPKEPVSPGDSWKREVELVLPSLGILRIRLTYFYRGPKQHQGETLERIDLQGKIALVGLDKKTPPRGEIKSQSMQGVLWFDNAAGRAVESSVKQTVTFAVETETGSVLQTNQSEITSRLKR
ncbi:MAG: hypothetical protein N2C14_00200 [Planctomycetales bacterium]